MKFLDDIDETSSQSNFVRLKDGETISGIPRGEIHHAYIVWENRKRREVSKGTPDAKFRFSMNFVVKEGTSYVAKIFEGGTMVYKQLKKLSKDYDLTETVIKITREGSELDTEYDVIPAPPKQQPSLEALAFIGTIELHDLTGRKNVRNFAPGSDDSETA